jgi:hypothetical protein
MNYHSPFGVMDQAARVRHFETEGYVVIPNALPQDEIARIKRELGDLPMRPSFYSEKPTFAAKPPHLHSPACTDLIANPAVLAFMRTLLGDDFIFIYSHYILSQPNQPALEVHSDFQPYGSTYSGWFETSPVRVRVLHYLDDTGTDRAPLRIVPRSHICFHADANPYKRYRAHPDEVLFPMRAGDAFVFAVRMFHGVGPNTSEHTRGMLEYDYRPLWARPYQPVEEWPETPFPTPEAVRPLLRGRNAFDFRWEFDVKRGAIDSAATGMSPHRWGKLPGDKT